jgi:Na+-driven multidrug efflux pump
MVILLNLAAFMFMLAMGFQEAVATVVGNSIGENDVPKAKKYFKLSACIALPCIYLWMSCFYIFRGSIEKVYLRGQEDDQELSDMFNKGIIIVTCIMTSDSTDGFL